MAGNDGGSAFPRPISTTGGDGSGTEHETACAHDGMSLRDYFAGQALIGMLSGQMPTDMEGQYSIWAYKHADAMLKAREG